MQRVVHPPVAEFDRLRRPMQPGERLVFDFFDRYLDPAWEIYVEPHLNGLRPDLVLLNPAVGVAVYEIKDWNLHAMRRFVRWQEDGPELWAERNGRTFKERNPVEQVLRYQRDIYQIYCPRLESTRGLAAITAGVIFPFADSARVVQLLKPFLSARSAYLPIIGQEELERGEIAKVLPAAGFRSSQLMRPELADDLRGWLVEPDVQSEQRRPLTGELDAKQRRLATERTVSGLRRVKGPAGSGKSLVLAARAAALADEGKSVLVVSFNITLTNYLRDLMVRAITRRGGSDYVVFTWFQAWCSDVCHRAGREKAYRALYGAMPRVTAAMSPEERRTVRNQRKMQADRINEHGLPMLVQSCLHLFNSERRDATELDEGEVSDDSPPILYDAILVDEGQDFLPIWWNTLREALRPTGEMLLVADATQDVYGTARAWTEEAMTGAGFAGGRWAQLNVSYRLPPKALHTAAEFARRFLPAVSIDLPLLRQGSLEPCELRWVQCVPEEALECCIAAVRALMRETGSRGLANADLTILTERIDFGAKVVEALEERNVRVLNTFADTEGQRRRQKVGFRKGSERIKATTLHSFKGWESRLLVVHVDQALGPEGLALVYVALTRLKASMDGSWLTVVCSAPELAEYGATWRDEQAS